MATQQKHRTKRKQPTTSVSAQAAAFLFVGLSLGIAGTLIAVNMVLARQSPNMIDLSDDHPIQRVAHTAFATVQLSAEGKKFYHDSEAKFLIQLPQGYELAASESLSDETFRHITFQEIYPAMSESNGTRKQSDVMAVTVIDRPFTPENVEKLGLYAKLEMLTLPKIETTERAIGYQYHIGDGGVSIEYTVFPSADKQKMITVGFSTEESNTRKLSKEEQEAIVRTFAYTDAGSSSTTALPQ